jgi:hypothetical protein
MAGIVAPIWFWVALRLWNLDLRGWIFVGVISVVHLIFDLIAWLGSTPMQAMWPSVLVSLVALILGYFPIPARRLPYNPHKYADGTRIRTKTPQSNAAGEFFGRQVGLFATLTKLACNKFSNIFNK